MTIESYCFCGGGMDRLGSFGFQDESSWLSNIVFWSGFVVFVCFGMSRKWLWCIYLVAKIVVLSELWWFYLFLKIYIPFVCRGYVGIHSSGFRDFLLKPELLRAIVDSGFEHPSEGKPMTLFYCWEIAIFVLTNVNICCII